MPPTYRYDHMHVRSRDVRKTAEWYRDVFDAEIVESIQSDGKPRTDLDLHAAGVTILLVEQNASLALQIADRAYVLEAGRLTIAGPAAELLTDERVRRAYLG